ATLMLSPLPLVRDLGLTLSMGVLLAALFGVLARKLVIEADDLDKSDDPGKTAPAGGAAPAEDAADLATPTLREMADRRGPVLAFLAATMIAAIGWFMLPTLPLQTDVQSFAAGLPALDDAQHVEQLIGSSGEIDIALQGKNVLTSDAVSWMEQVETQVI